MVTKQWIRHDPCPQIPTSGSGSGLWESDKNNYILTLSWGSLKAHQESSGAGEYRMMITKQTICNWDENNEVQPENQATLK